MSARLNGGMRPTTFVAELGGGEPGSEYLARAKCTRCVPTWRGPIRKTSNFLEEHPAATYPAALQAVRDQCRRDVLAHCDRAHDGTLRS